ncbi:MAG TPA: DNA-binding protein [Prolixibacteraceae bacterium]|nr:DNA-binding protein [Odoribacter sp.]MDP3641630.1 DNA-binding protein [Bacteroidota bacterium]HAQ18814.1 DNA-binding protein [Prolixibacteraceae bacterium]
MERKITFNELRHIKDSLPAGSISQIAQEFGIEVETVRNYFGGANYDKGKSVGLHIEPGPGGGVVLIDDSAILDRAQQLLAAH